VLVLVLAPVAVGVLVQVLVWVPEANLLQQLLLLSQLALRYHLAVLRL
jgi:hypothetical protein